MQRTRTRWIAASASTVLSLVGALVFALWWRARAPVGLRFHETGDLSAIRLERQAYAAERAPIDPADPRAWRYYLSRENASNVFAIDENPELRVYDPWTYYVSAPNRRVNVPWAEHDKGGYRLITNSAGLRDDEFDPDQARDLFVVAAGDSHTFGICNNHESWPNRLELALSKRFKRRRIEVLNAAAGGFTFYQYLGTLEKYLNLDPDALVVAVYGGNDFTELLTLQELFGEGPPVRRFTRAENRMRKAAAEAHRNAMGQCFNSTWTLTRRPELQESLVATALGLVGEMKAICEQRGMLFVVALIPAPCQYAFEPPIADFDELREELGLSEADCGILDRVADRFVAGLAELGVTTVDMRAPFSATHPPPYWRRDQHLDVRGHRLLAEALEPIVEGWVRETGRLADE